MATLTGRQLSFGAHSLVLSDLVDNLHTSECGRRVDCLLSPLIERADRPALRGAVWRQIPPRPVAQPPLLRGLHAAHYP